MTAGDLDSLPLGRIVRPADYVRVLAAPLRLRSPHFAVHHLAGRPLPLRRPPVRDVATGEASNAALPVPVGDHSPVTARLSTELSTDRPNAGAAGVDDLHDPGPAALGETPTPPGGIDRWLGLVVPKRHAKRAVTRTLVKRQIRNVASACAARLEPGLWVVRQRAPFDPAQFPSAASEALKEAARAELRMLFDRAVRGERDRVKPRPADGAPRRGKPAKPRPAAPGPAGDTPCAA